MQCVVCGPDNPRGLQLRFDHESDGFVISEWEPTSDWEGFEGVIHGGVISAVLDEAMSQAVVAKRWRAMTCELKVRYRRHVATGEGLRVRGWVVERKRRRLSTEASLTTIEGEERARAWGTFLAVW